MPSFDCGDDFVGVSGPCEGFGLVIVFFDEAVDGVLQVCDGVEDAAFEASPCELGEEAFDGVAERVNDFETVGF